MALEEELIEWAASRPSWQQRVLRDLAVGSPPDRENVREIVESLVAGVEPDTIPLTVAELPGAGGPGKRVVLGSVEPVEHVNALLDGERLTFGIKGLTVVYGDNASGKSGYARLLKQVVRARHREDVLTDIFQDRNTDVPAARIGYEVDGAHHDEDCLGATDPVLGQVGYYDEPCGDAYISTDSAVTYRPSALVLLDGLITVCDGVRDTLDAMLTANTQQRGQLPAVGEGSAARSFIDSLTASTTVAQIDAVCAVPADIDDQIAALSADEARLRAADPTSERTRLTQLASRMRLTADHLDQLLASLGVDAVTNLLSKQQAANELRAAAEIASSR